MPLYLKRDTIRLFEAGVEAISLAVTALGLPKRYETREASSENAIAIGLAGVSAELIMSSIIVQAQGEKALHLPSGYYKTGTHIVDDFRTLINSQIPKMVFLTQGVANPTAHISNVLKAVSKFKLLTKSRAGGLHAGKGPSRDVSIVCVNDVISFIRLLGESTRIKPYTDSTPRIIEMTKSYELIIDDLTRKAIDSSLDHDKSNALASIYLVLPELPDAESEWFPAFDRLCVAPKDNDVSFLLDTLEKSKYASLIKVSKSKEGIPVVVQKGNPCALPIEPQYLKKSFLDIRDRWYADRGTANGRLDQKQFDPPPVESAYEIFTFQFHILQITKDENEMLYAADTWPLIAASLSYIGTLGPYWYFVKKTSDLEQLESYLTRAEKIGGQAFKTGIQEFKIGFDAIKKKTSLSKKVKFVETLLNTYERIQEKKETLEHLLKKHDQKDKQLCKEAEIDLCKVAKEELPVGDMLVKIAEGSYTFLSNESRTYWARILCDVASELDDTQGLLAILKVPEFSVAYTSARKAFRLIDFTNFGPKI